MNANSIAALGKKFRDEAEQDINTALSLGVNPSVEYLALVAGIAGDEVAKVSRAMFTGSTIPFRSWKRPETVALR